MFKAIVFDFDGVIVNGIPFHDKAYIEVFKKHGKKVTIPLLHSKIGLTSKEVFSQFFKKSTKAEINKLVKEHQDILFELYKKNSTIPKNLTKFLESCKRNNLRVALASSTNSKILKMVLKKFGIKNHFKAIVGGETVKKGKPNPEMLKKALNKLKIEPKHAIAIDDSKQGITAAKKLKMYTIAYTKYTNKIPKANQNIKNFPPNICL